MNNKKYMFVFEMANNHMGDINHGMRMIDEFAKITSTFDFLFAFKLQYRQLDSFIHHDFQNRSDIKFIKRFSETRLSKDDFKKLKDYIEHKGFISICTPFDEPSVDLIEEHGFKYIKIGSCSFSDWPLLERIAKSKLPIIASTAGIALEEIDNVVSFFEHRDRELSLMHCVAEYPTNADNLQLNQIDLLKNRYPAHRIGYSTHENPEDVSSISIAISKGATIFEKHVGLENNKYKLNAYSASPLQVLKWLTSARETLSLCGIEGERHLFTEKELKDLRDLKRGVFAKVDFVKGQKLDLSKVFYAIPIEDDQLSTSDLSKYTEYHFEKNIEKNKPVHFSDVTKIELREKVHGIIKKVSSFISESKVSIPSRVDFEISHHYGIDKFYEFGTTIINFINREYCKKLIILLPGQTHPEQYHKLKEETFYIMFGKLELTLDGVTKEYKHGDMILIEKGVKHKMFSKSGAIIEEISSTHILTDSYYTEEYISNNKHRKTYITLWINPTE